MTKKVVLVLMVLTVVGIGIFAGYRYREAKLKEKVQGPKTPQDRPVVVNIAQVRKQTMRDERIFSGTTTAWSSFNIEPKVTGKLKELQLDIGDIVKKGEVIARIDDKEYLQDVRVAEANLAYQRAKLKEAQGILTLKDNEFKRQQRLKMSQATSDSSYEAAESAYAAQMATTEMCAAEVQRCEATLANAKIKLGDTIISAEWNDGSDLRYIGNRFVDEGTLLLAGTPVVSILELDRIKASIQIIERDYRFMKIGQKAEVTTDAYPGEIFIGEVNKIGSILSEKTRNAPAVISIQNQDLKLRPGMFVRVRILLNEKKETQTVPVNAILIKNNQTGVFCYFKSSGKAVFVPVKTGLSTREEVEILSPELKHPVITVGNHLLDNGKSVVISELTRGELVEKEYGNAETAQ